MAGNDQQSRTRRVNDERFTCELLLDVIAVLRDHGYQLANERGRHIVNLQQHLFQWLYDEGGAS